MIRVMIHGIKYKIIFDQYKPVKFKLNIEAQVNLPLALYRNLKFDIKGLNASNLVFQARPMITIK